MPVHLHRRVPDRVGHPRRRSTGGDCDARQHRAAAGRQQRPGRISSPPASDRAEKPCTYCNKCLVHVVEHPLGCYEESRFASRRRRCWRRSCRSSSRRRSRDAANVVVAAALRSALACRRSSLAVVARRLGRRVASRADRPVDVRRHRGALQVRIDRQRARRLAAAARSAACCRRTGCSRRCRRSAATSCRAATRRSGSSSSPGRTCRSASRGGGGSASIRSGLTARSATPARCATRPAAAPRIVLGMPAQQLDLQAFVAVRARLHARQPRSPPTRPRPPAEIAAGPSLFERVLLRVGLVDRLKIQTLDLRNRIAPILRRPTCRAGAAAASTRSIPTRRFSSTGSSTSCRPAS